MTKKLGILLYENVQPMDVIGPWEVLSFWKNTLEGDIDMMLIAENASHITCDNNIILKAHTDFKQAPALDYLIVPGGRGRVAHQHPADPLIQFIKQQSTSVQYMIAICTGMFLVREAGLLEEKAVTTYWRALQELEAFPTLKHVGERVVKSDNIWMSGGVSSGIDLAFELIADIAGKEMAGKVQLLFEYFPNQTVYCTKALAGTLPLYPGSEKHGELPKYILEYIAGRENKT